MTMDQMENRRVYWLQSRNLRVGVWNLATQGFIGVRHKFGDTYLFTEYHYDSSPTIGTAMPLEGVDDLWIPDGVLLNERLPGSWCGEQLDREVRFQGDLPAGDRWRHVDDGTTCRESRVLDNQELLDILQPLDARRMEEELQYWEAQDRK